MIGSINQRWVTLDDKKLRYYGKFRGTVVNNVDPKGEGRLQVLVPAVSSVPLANWAMICTPVGGLQHGMFSVPPPGAGCWIEFEDGDPDYPIWTGCFIGSAALDTPKQAPPASQFLQAITLQTPTQNCLVINDAPGPSGCIQLRIHGQTMVTVSEGYIKLDNGLGASIELEGPVARINGQMVSINDSALTVT